MKKNTVMFSVFEVIVIWIIAALFGACGMHHMESRKTHYVKDWNERLPWTDYKKEAHIKGNIKRIYVSGSCLCILTDKNEFIPYGTLEVK